jgi:multidrug resistance protein, MATE family
VATLKIIENGLSREFDQCTWQYFLQRSPQSSRQNKINSPLFANITRLLRLALPVTIGQLAIVGMSITDIIIAGKFSTNDLAGVALGSAIFNLSIMLTVGIVLGNGPIIAQFFGAGDRYSVRDQCQNCLRLCGPLGLFSAGLVGGGIIAIPLIETAPAVALATNTYLWPMVGTAFVLPFMLAFRTTFESMGQARPAMIFNALGFLINIPLDYALVFGYWGLPELGGAGCGWASLVVSLFIVIGEFLYARRATALAGYGLLRPSLPVNWRRIKETLRVGVPIGFAILAEGGFFLIIPLFIAHLGAVIVAGHSIAISFDWAMFMIPLGISQAISVLSAHEIGRGRGDMARKICYAGLGLTVVIALFQASLVVIFRHNIAAFFSPDPQVKQVAALLLVYAAAFRVFDAINVAGNGALRGYKDTRITVILALTGYWLIGFPLSYSLALTEFWGPPLGVEGFWTGMVAALIITSILTSLRVYKTTGQFLRQGIPR